MIPNALAESPMHEALEGEGEAMGSNVYPMPMESLVPPGVLEARQKLMRLQRLLAVPNAATVFDADLLAGLGQRVVREYGIDRDSRDEWTEMARKALDASKQKRTPKSHPWPDASNVKYPMLTVAALQFAARAYPAIVDGPRIVKCTVLGRDPDGRKAGAADRVSQHMSYQLLYEMPEWESDMDTCLHQIPIIGCAFKKVYPDPTSPAGACSTLVSALDFVVNQKTKSLETVPRATHVFTLYPQEIRERVADGRFIEFDWKSGAKDDSDDESPHTFLEQHRYFDSDEDGMPEPWIVTVHEQLQKVVRMKPCFDLDGVTIDQERGKITRFERHKYFVKIPFIPDPEGGFYDIGFGKLLESVSDIIDSTINQMMDAGTLQNSGGGFIGAGVNLGSKGTVRFKPGEYKSVASPGPDLRQAIVNMEHPGPAPVLLQLLQMMIEAGKDIASVKDILTGETPSNQTATSTMAAIEQGLKVFTAIYKRIFRALKIEFKLLFDINRKSLDVPKYVALLDEPVEVCAQDYMGEIDVMPVADPNTVTDMQRMAKAQLLMEQVAAGNPAVDPFESTRRAFEAARIERIDDVLKQPQPGPADKIALEGEAAKVDLTRAQVAKTVADAEVSRAGVGLPIGAPMQVAEPVFMPPEQPPGMDPGIEQGMPGPEQEPMPPYPEMEQGAAMPMDKLQTLGMQFGGGFPPEPETAPAQSGLG